MNQYSNANHIPSETAKNILGRDVPITREVAKQLTRTLPGGI